MKFTWSHTGLSESRSVVSDFLWPHGLYSPWNSPAQNTRMGILSLLQGSSQPKEWTQISHTAGRFLTSWATGEAHTGLGWAPKPITMSLQEERTHRDTPRDENQLETVARLELRSCKEDQGFSGAIRSWKTQVSSWEPSEETWSCWCPDCTLLASGIVREYIFVVLSTWLVVCYSSPRRLVQFIKYILNTSGLSR